MRDRFSRLRPAEGGAILALFAPSSVRPEDAYKLLGGRLTVPWPPGPNGYRRSPPPSPLTPPGWGPPVPFSGCGGTGYGDSPRS